MYKKSITQILQKDSLKWVYNICKWGYLKSRMIVFKIASTILLFWPLQEKVIASAYNGKRYDDNTRYIVEKIHEIDPGIEIRWLMDNHATYELPDYIQGVRCCSQWKLFRKVYEYSTAKVILDTHLLDSFYKKRKGQLFIETWHGGLGIKKIELDVDKFVHLKSHVNKIQNTAREADLFISNSTHLTNIYKRAFQRKGKIWECGYPKNDKLISASKEEILSLRTKVRNYFHLSDDVKIILYAPTFRDETRNKGIFHKEWYDIQPEKVQKAFQKMFHTEQCVLLIKLHPFLISIADTYVKELKSSVINATEYPNMQELIMGSDALISDYSSCIFDAAMFGLPCFTFANDFENYKGDRGTYFEMTDLPFPYAKTAEELCDHILLFDQEQYKRRWKNFSDKVGIKETGHAGQDIAEYVCQYMKHQP